MSDRSFGEFLGGGLFWTVVIQNFGQIVKGTFSFSGKFLVWFIVFGFVGYFVQLFSGPPISGPISPSDIRVSAYGTLDHLTVTVWNPTDHLIRRIDMDCGNQNVMLNNIGAGESANYDTFAGNIMRGPITCDIVELKSK